MELRGANNERYITGRELGRGGEGAVYELLNQPGYVLKKYTEQLSADKIAKLKQMVAMRSAGIETYAAWPIDIVRDESGLTCGFVMKKLIGFVPLHMIFSPMDRKKLFPDKGYNFLAHVARNLATAFYKLHEAGLVVGDVNEGNILISASGMVAFIDCDSFQVRGEQSYYYCEVGVPRYTPPELLKEGSFEQVVRTVNTDSFSLAILIFQLLFLGRHPFAGRNKASGDIDEETAIRQKQFAYSLENKRKKLSPPKDSFSITNLPEDIIGLFHRAFEQDERPLPAEWIKSLDGLLAKMISCAESGLHVYPAGLAECPWCTFKTTRGILYFLDDSYLQANAALADIERFVNGFRIEKLELGKWNGPRSFAGMDAQVDARFYNYRKKKKLFATLLSILGTITVWTITFSINSKTGLTAQLTSFFVFATISTTFLASIYYKLSNKLNIEHRRVANLLHAIDGQLNKTINEYNNPADLDNYNKALSNLQRHVENFRNLPEEFQRRKRLMDQRVYNEQLDDYLFQFRIEDYDIPAIGPGRKTALLNSGIFNAAHISKLQGLKVAGIGPKYQQILFSWQRQMASGFVYIPNSYTIQKELIVVNNEIATIKANLEHAIKKEYHSLNNLRQHLSNRAGIIARQITDLSTKHYQAHLDLEEITRLTKW